MQANLYLIIVIGVLLSVIFPIIIIFTTKGKTLKTITVIFTTLYTIILLVGVLFSINFAGSQVTIIFDISGEWMQASSFILFNFSLNNFLINIFMLIPYSFVVFVFSNKNYLLKCWIIGILIGSIIGSLQFILPVARTVEITDIFYNGFSVLLGGILNVLIFRKKNVKY